MRSTFARRSSAIALAGALAFAGAACGDDDPETDIDVTEPADDETVIEEGDTTIEEETTIEDTSTDPMTDGATDESTE